MKRNRKFPYTIQEEPKKLAEKWAHFESRNIVYLDDSRKCKISGNYTNAAEAIYNFKVRPDDIWVVTFPRSGTTLTQELVWLIVNNDYETAQNVPLIKRFPFLEMNTAVSDEVIQKAKERMSNDKEKLDNFLQIMSAHWVTLENKVDRRFIKTHLPFDLLPPELLTAGCKVLYIARNPKDVAVSSFKFFYHNSTDEEFPEFYNLFQGDAFMYAPYWDHVIQGWEKRNNKNVCFIFYEDLVKDMKGTIKKVAAFLEKDITDEQLEKLAEHLNIKNIRNNKSITIIQAHYLRGIDERPFVRKGEVGDWRNYFTDELNIKANKWIEENYKRTDLRFPVRLDF